MVAHEQLHEDGADKCLTEGRAAAAVLAEMEGFTEDGSEVKRDFDEAFVRFLEDHFEDAMETDTLTPLSPAIREWRDTQDAGRIPDDVRAPVAGGRVNRCLSRGHGPRRPGLGLRAGVFERSKPPCMEGEGPPDCATGRSPP